MIDASIPQFAVTDEQYRELLPTMRVVAADEDVGRLARGLALSEGFALHLVGCATPKVAQALILCLASQVPTLRGLPVKMMRLAPTRAPDAPLDPQALGREVFDRLLLLDEGPRVVYLDATDSRTDDREAWLWLFQRLNERRNHLYVIGAPLVLLLPPDLSIELIRFAPDLWSIRSMGIRLLGGGVVEQRGADLPISSTNAEEPVHTSTPSEMRRLEAQVAQLLRKSGPHARRALVVEFQRLASALYERGEARRALDLLNQKILPHIRASKESMLPELMFGLTETLVRLGQPAEAERLARQEAIPHLERVSDNKAVLLTLVRLSDSFREAGLHSQSLSILQKEVLPRAEALEDLEVKAIALSKTVIEMFDSHQLAPGHQLLEEHRSLFEQWLSPSINAAVHVHLAEAQRRQGDPAAALGTLRHRVLPLVGRIETRLEVLAWMMLGQAHKDRGELQEAIAIWRDKALPWYRRQGNTANCAMVQTMISRVLLELGHREEGHAMLREAVDSRSRWKGETLQQALDRRDAALQIAALFLVYEKPEEAKGWLRSVLIETSPLWEEERIAIQSYLGELESLPAGTEVQSTVLHTQAGAEVYEQGESETRRPPVV